MPTLHDRLIAAVKIRRVIAEAATPGPWEYATHEGRTYIGRADTQPSVAEVEFFCHRMGCQPDTEVTRIEWRYLEDE